MLLLYVNRKINQVAIINYKVSVILFCFLLSKNCTWFRYVISLTRERFFFPWLILIFKLFFIYKILNSCFLIFFNYFKMLMLKTKRNIKIYFQLKNITLLNI